MINEWEQDIDLDGVDSAWGGTAGGTPAPTPPETGVRVLKSGAAAAPMDETPSAPAPPAEVRLKEAGTQTSALDKIQATWEAKLNKKAAQRDAEADPRRRDALNVDWAQAQMQYVNAYNERADDAADFEWAKSAQDILDQTTADYENKYPIDSGLSGKAGREEMIRTAIAAPKEGRLPKPSKRKELAQEYTEAGLTSQLDVSTGRALTAESAAARRNKSETENEAMVAQLEEQISGLDGQIVEAQGGSVVSEGLIRDRQRLIEQLAPRLARKQQTSALFRQEVRNEMPGAPVRISGTDPTVGSRYRRSTLEKTFLPLFSPLHQTAEADRLGIDVPLSAEEMLVTSGRLTHKRKSGGRLAPILPAEIVMGRKAGGRTVYRHKETGEGLRINPNDFGAKGNEQALADLKAGKLERLGYERVEDAGTSYTDVDDKVRVAAARVAVRLQQIEARRAQVQDLIAGLQEEAEQKARPRWQAGGRYRDSTDRVLGGSKPATGFIGVVDDIQAYQREISSLDDLQQRLGQIRDVTLGGYTPSAEDYARFKPALEDEGLPGSTRESREAVEALKEQSGNGE
jgi:hypothetical protein